MDNQLNALAVEIAKEIKNHGFSNLESIANGVNWDDISTGRLFTQNISNNSIAGQTNAPGTGRWIGFTNVFFNTYKVQIAWLVSVTGNPTIKYRGWASSTGWGSWDTIAHPEAYYDSGIRNINSLVTNLDDWLYEEGYNAYFRVQRKGYTVSLSMDNIFYRGPSQTVTALTLPVGFRPNINQYFHTFRGTVVVVQTSGDVRFYNTNPSNQLDYCNYNYLTNNVIPSTLPGTNV